MSERRLALLLARNNAEARVRQAILDRYEMGGTQADRVPSREVYEVAAELLGQAVSGALAKQVKRICLGMGAVFIKPFNRRYFARMRRKADELVPGQGKSPAAIRRAWEQRLKREGLGEEPRRLPNLWKFRETINAATFQQLRDDYWRRRKELDIWGLYAIEGLSVREVGAKLDMAKSDVGDVVSKFRKEMGLGHLTEGQETGADEEKLDD